MIPILIPVTLTLIPVPIPMTLIMISTLSLGFPLVCLNSCINTVKCLLVSQNIQQAAFQNDNQFTLYDWKEISEVVYVCENPNF